MYQQRNSTGGSMHGANEPKEAFPYRPPSDELKSEFEHIFARQAPISMPITKLLFDKTFAALLLIAFAPIIIVLAVTNFIEGLLIPANRGPLFYFYYAASQGKRIRKYKVRCIKDGYVNHEAAAKGLWQGYSAEWNPEARTMTGSLVKKFYLDEIPQLYSILKGDLTLVGPRALSWHHYERDVAQGNVTRRLVRGGLLGPNQAMKGRVEMGDPRIEYEYVDGLLKLGSIAVVLRDIQIIWQCIRVVLRGKGL